MIAGVPSSSSAMDEAEHDRVMARVLEVAPHDMTFEDGLRILEFMTSFNVLFCQAENEQPVPDPVKLARFDAVADEFLKARAGLMALWQTMVREHQSTLREYQALLSARPEHSQ